jgi:hypothetical protein
MPWTWMRVLRDEGPKNRDFLCAMLTLHTWMDVNGFAYPSLRTWAKGARMSTNTLTKHYKAALRDGWLGVEQHGGGQAWRRNSYRAAVPLNIELSDKDEKLSDALISQFGDIEAVSPIRETPSEPQPASCVAHAETPLRHQPPQAVSSMSETPSSGKTSSNGANPGEGVSNGGPLAVSKVSQTALKGVSNGSERCLTQSEAEVLKSEVLKSEVLEHSSKRKVLRSRATPPPSVDNSSKQKGDTPEAREARAAIFLKATPDISTATSQNNSASARKRP